MTKEVWEYPNSTLERMIDGDSFVANFTREITTTTDVGFHIKSTTTTLHKGQIRFRLNRVACASSKTPSGFGAYLASQYKLAAAPFNLKSVGPYKFGDEWMAEVTLADGTNLSDWLIERQWGVFWNGNGAQPIPPWPRTVTP
jgi:endonuclease YncB( thermonuclease family)